MDSAVRVRGLEPTGDEWPESYQELLRERLLEHLSGPSGRLRGEGRVAVMLTPNLARYGAFHVQLCREQELPP